MRAQVRTRRAVIGLPLGPWDDQPYIPATASGYNTARHQFDLELPSSGSGPFPLALWIHAGGWQNGSKDTSPTHWSRGVLSQGVAWASLGYRLSSHAAFPAQRHDIGAAIRYLRANADIYNVDPTRFGIIAYSAGMHLGVFTALTADDPAWANTGFGHAGVSEAVYACYGFSGPMRFATEESEMTTNFGSVTRTVASTTSQEGALLGGLNPYDTPSGGVAAALAASPYSNIPTATANSARFRLEHGTDDQTVPYQQSQAMHTALQAAGYTSAYTAHAGETHGSVVTNTTITNAMISALCTLLTS